MTTSEIVLSASAVVQAVATAGIFWWTWRYVLFTKQMMLEMRRQNERLERPDVQVVLGPGRNFSAIQELTIRNVGNGPATDVRVTVTPDDLPSVLGIPFREMSIFTVPIAYLPQRQEMTTMLFNSNEVQTGRSGDVVLTFAVTYRTLAGEEASSVAEYNLGMYRHMTDFTTRNLGDVVEQLKKLVEEAQAQTQIARSARQRFFPEPERFSLVAWVQERWSELRYGRRMRFRRAAVNVLNPNGSMRGPATAAFWVAVKRDGTERWGGTLEMPSLNSSQVVPTEEGTKLILKVDGGDEGWATITRYVGGWRQRASFVGDGVAPF